MAMGIDDTIGMGMGRNGNHPVWEWEMALNPMGINSHRRQM